MELTLGLDLLLVITAGMFSFEVGSILFYALPLFYLILPVVFVLINFVSFYED